MDDINKQYFQIMADVYFYPTEKGGRKGQLPPNQYRCPMILADEKFDCMLNLPFNETILPGDTVFVSIEFLSPEIVLPMLHIGKKFNLWEGGVIADGEIKNLTAYNNASESASNLS